VDGMCSSSEFGAMPYWEVSRVTSMRDAFKEESTFNADITGWSTPNLVSSSNMFLGATAWLAKFKRTDGSASVDGPPSSWTPPITTITDDNFQSAVTTCLRSNPVDGMCSSSKFGAMPEWDVSRVTSMGWAFMSKTTFNADVSRWDTSSVEGMFGVFYLASAFNQPLASWKTTSVTSTTYMFNGASAFAQDITGWSTPALSSDVTYDMFNGATAWLAKFERVDQSASKDGPPSKWRIKT
jgi:hypothetical protein